MMWSGDAWQHAPDGRKEHDPQWWVPLCFDAQGNIQNLTMTERWDLQVVPAGADGFPAHKTDDAGPAASRPPFPWSGGASVLSDSASASLVARSRLSFGARLQLPQMKNDDGASSTRPRTYKLVDASRHDPRPTRVVDIPWEYLGFRAFPAAWFGASPTGSASRGMMPESNATMATMARHQLVGWGWQQGMYDFPCDAVDSTSCLRYAAEGFAVYTILNGTGLHPTFSYRHTGGAGLSDPLSAQALNCSANWTTYPTVEFACGLSDPAVAKLRKEWFLHDADGGDFCTSLPIQGKQGGGAVALTWQHSAPGAVAFWDEVIGGWYAENLNPAQASPPHHAPQEPADVGNTTPIPAWQ